MHVEREMNKQGLTPDKTTIDEAVSLESLENKMTEVSDAVSKKLGVEQRFIIRGRNTLIIQNDAKVKKEAFKLTDKRLREAGLRKYFDIENERYLGSPNQEKKLKIANILRETIEETVAKRKALIEKAQRIR